MSLNRHRPRKSFGQHWLIDDYILDQIVDAASIKPTDRILEIGPGKGALTRKLLDTTAQKVHAIELDKSLINGLNKRFSENPKFSLMQGDVITSELLPIDGIPLNKVIANIPYNITGPILDRLLGRLGQPLNHVFTRLVLLLQREVADRILAKEGDSLFSSLSVRMQLMASCKGICNVPPESFDPIPKVNSKVILIDPITNSDRLSTQLENTIDLLLRTAFHSRRKMIKNTISNLYPIDTLSRLSKEINITLDMRPQDLSPTNWLDLARGFNSLESSI